MKLLPGCPQTATGVWENEKAFLTWVRCGERNGHNLISGSIIFALCQGQLAARSWGSRQGIFLSCLWRSGPHATSAVLPRLIYGSFQRTWPSPPSQDSSAGLLLLWVGIYLFAPALHGEKITTTGKVKGHLTAFLSACFSLYIGKDKLQKD